jgi:hypothetical protein
MSGTQGASNPIPTVVKVLVALALMMFLAPFVVVVVVFLLSAMAGGTWYYATTSTVAASRVSAVRSTMSQLAAGVREEQALSSCGDPEVAMAAARSQGLLKAMLRPEEPGEACLLALGADPSPLYGRFWVVAGPPFEIHGVVDLDEDGELLHLVWKEGGQLETVSED